MAQIITDQPGIMMSSPAANVLDLVKDADFLKIRQKVDLLEVFTGFEVKNRYEVVDAQERCLLYVREESDTCHRCFCAPLHTLSLHVTDVSGQEVARMHRKFKCCAGCCWCANADRCSIELWVESPVGQSIAHIKERSFCCYPKFQILDGNEKEVFQVGGPCCCFCQGPGCTDDLEFPVYMNGQVVARVTKIWDGVARACCTNASTFGLHFTKKDLDLNKKLAVFGCAFELDYLFFEMQDQGQ